MINLQVLYFICILVFFESIAFYSLSKYNQTSKRRWLFTAMIIYGVVVVTLLTKALKYRGIGSVNFVWNCFSTVTAFLIGVMLFGEKVNNMQWIGVALAMVGLSLILIEPSKI